MCPKFHGPTHPRTGDPIPSWRGKEATPEGWIGVTQHARRSICFECSLKLEAEQGKKGNMREIIAFVELSPFAVGA